MKTDTQRANYNNMQPLLSFQWKEADKKQIKEHHDKQIPFSPPPKVLWESSKKMLAVLDKWVWK